MHVRHRCFNLVPDRGKTNLTQRVFFAGFREFRPCREGRPRKRDHDRTVTFSQNAPDRPEGLVKGPLIFFHLSRIETGSFEQPKDDVRYIALRGRARCSDANEYLRLQPVSTGKRSLIEATRRRSRSVRCDHSSRAASNSDPNGSTGRPSTVPPLRTCARSHTERRDVPG